MADFSFIYPNASISIAKLKYDDGTYSIDKIYYGQCLWDETSKTLNTGRQNTLSGSTLQGNQISYTKIDAEVSIMEIVLDDDKTMYRVKKGNNYYTIEDQAPYLDVLQGYVLHVSRVTDNKFTW